MMTEPSIVKVSSSTPGRTLSVRRWRPPGQTIYPPVVCVHGLLRLSRDFDDLAADLSADREVWALDVAGRGDSQWLEAPADYGYPTYVADAIALLSVIQEETRSLDVDWVGTSMGGLIALMLPAALAAGNKQGPGLRRVVLNDVGPFIGGGALARILDYATIPPGIFSDMAAASATLRDRYAPFAPPNEAAWQKLIGDSLRPVKGGLTVHYDPAIATALQATRPAEGAVPDLDLWSLWDHFPAETLVLRGIESDVLTKDTAAEMVRRGQGRTELAVIDGCGHAPMLVRPAEISAIRRFLDEGLGG